MTKSIEARCFKAGVETDLFEFQENMTGKQIRKLIRKKKAQWRSSKYDLLANPRIHNVRIVT